MLLVILHLYNMKIMIKRETNNPYPEMVIHNYPPPGSVGFDIKKLTTLENNIDLELENVGDHDVPCSNKNNNKRRYKPY